MKLNLKLYFVTSWNLTLCCIYNTLHVRAVSQGFYHKGGRWWSDVFQETVKAIILDSATECLTFFIETSPKCLHLNDVMLSLFIISTMQCICCVSFSFPGLLSFFSWCGLGMRRKMCPVCKFICNSYWTEYNSGS